MLIHRNHHRLIRYDDCLRDFYMEEGKAIIVCRIEGIADVVSRYSAPGRENLNPELAAYLDDNIFYIPLRIPIVLRFIGRPLSEKEKEITRRTILSTYEFKLALAQADLRHNRWYTMLTLIIGISFLALYFILGKSNALGVIISIIFWFFLWEFGSSGWTQNRALNQEIKNAERVADAEILFCEAYTEKISV